jgi:hypothetical protein
VIYNASGAVMKRLQDDLKRIFNLGRLAAERVHLPGRLAHGDESAPAVEGPGSTHRSEDHGGQYDHGIFDVHEWGSC